MASYRDGSGTYEIPLDRARKKLETGTPGGSKGQLDFGRACIHLTSESELSLADRVRGWWWPVKLSDPNGFDRTVHHALIETHAGATDEQAADVAKRFGGELQTGFFAIPNSGLRRSEGPYVTLLAAPETAVPTPPPPPVPTITLATLVRDKRAAEARIKPVLVDREARKQRLDRASAALKEARQAFVNSESEAAAKLIESAERELRLATLMHQAAPDVTALERELEAATAALNAVLCSSPALELPYFNGYEFTQATTFEHIARSYYANGTSWLSHGPKEQGHAMFAFDAGEATRLELHQRFRFRCVAHGIDVGWRITAPLSRPVTDAELATVAAFLGATTYHLRGTTPSSGSARVVVIDEWSSLDVDVVLAAQQQPAGAKEAAPAAQQTGAA